MTGDGRLAAARAVLQAAGLTETGVAAAGHDRCIAVIERLEPDRLAAVLPVVPAIKALGFRYVTIDITGPES